jgi:hypothetical protein
MSARTDRIAKLTAAIEREITAHHPNRAEKFAELRTKFSAMRDDQYDDLMALNARSLATGIGPSGLRIDDTTGWKR